MDAIELAIVMDVQNNIGKTEIRDRRRKCDGEGFGSVPIDHS